MNKNNIRTTEEITIFNDMEIIHEIDETLTKDRNNYVLTALYVGSYDPETGTTEAENALFSIIELTTKAESNTLFEAVKNYLDEAGEDFTTEETKTEKILSIMDTDSASHTGEILHNIINILVA